MREQTDGLARDPVWLKSDALDVRQLPYGEPREHRTALARFGSEFKAMHAPAPSFR